MLNKIKKIAIAASAFFCCCSIASATDAGMNLSIFGFLVLLGCVPALFLLPFAVIRYFYVRLRARRDGTIPVSTRWWVAAALLSLLPWMIVALASFPGTNGMLGQ